jgi:predicted nucleic acid-binding protein
MIFADLVSGSSIFLDANTLIYHFTAEPFFGPPCNQLMHQIHGRHILGYTSTHVLTELAHRLMTIEAIRTFGWAAVGIVKRLLKHPTRVQQLTVCRQAFAEVPRLNVQVLTISPALVEAATGVSQQTGLLSNDALIVAVMQANGLTNLASNDAAFDRVPGLTRYAPA